MSEGEIKSSEVADTLEKVQELHKEAMQAADLAKKAEGTDKADKERAAENERESLANKLEEISQATGDGAATVREKLSEAFGGDKSVTLKDLAKDFRGTEDSFEDAEAQNAITNKLNEEITKRKAEEKRSAFKKAAKWMEKVIGGGAERTTEFVGDHAGALFVVLALAGLARLFYAAFHNNGGCQQHNPAIAAGNLEGGWTSLTSNTASLFNTKEDASKNCNGYSCSFCHYLNPPGSRHSVGVNGAPAHLLAPTSPMLQSSNTAGQCTLSPTLSKTNLMAARMQQYDCLNRVNYPLCSPKPMSDMCANASEETCTNVKPISRICTYAPDTGCTIREEFKDLTPSWEAAPENTFGIYYAFHSHTVPQDAQLAYVTAEGNHPPPLGQTSGFQFAPASTGLINTAQWCHNAGGLWLAPTEDQDKVTGGWGCVSPPGPDGDSTVKFVGDDFQKYQTDLGLGYSQILANTTIPVCSSDGCKIAYTDPPTPSSPKATLIDYYDCTAGDDNKWIPIQNNPCHDCKWYDMWGVYEAETSLDMTAKLAGGLGGLVMGLFDGGFLTYLIWAGIALVIICVALPALKTAKSTAGL